VMMGLIIMFGICCAGFGGGIGYYVGCRYTYKVCMEELQKVLVKK